MPSRKSAVSAAADTARARASDLSPNPLNPRDITPDAAVSLARSMRELGDLSCIIFNATTGRLVGGHQRLSQLPPDAPLTQTESLPEPDAAGTVGYGHIEAHGTRWPVRYVAWDEPREAAAMAAANNPALQGHYTSAIDALIADVEAALPDLADDLRLADIVAADLSAADRATLDAVAPAEVPGMDLRPFEHYDYVLVLARNIHDWNCLTDALGLDRVNASPITGKRKIGLGRAVEAARLVALLKERPRVN